ncbi:MAG: HEPN domain-containing protein [Clostridia bacterium]|jgi:HEPN domain-containing protein|nr:HEPN domain-containing protein [Clostridia bacterium]
MNSIDLMEYWIESADEDYNVMLDLKEKNRNTYCLFFGQMVIEKLLKALYAKNNKGAPYAPKTHDLLYLAEKLNLELTEEQEVTLNEITTFNLSTRYDDYKREFYNKCTDEYTEEQINKIKEVKTWLEIMLK